MSDELQSRDGMSGLELRARIPRPNDAAISDIHKQSLAAHVAKRDAVSKGDPRRAQLEADVENHPANPDRGRKPRGQKLDEDARLRNRPDDLQMWID